MLPGSVILRWPMSYMPISNIMKSDYNLTRYVVLFRVEFETLFRLHLRNVQIYKECKSIYFIGELIFSWLTFTYRHNHTRLGEAVHIRLGEAVHTRPAAVVHILVGAVRAGFVDCNLEVDLWAAWNKIHKKLK